MSGAITNSSLASLPPPVFVTDSAGLDPSIVLSQMIDEFQTATGRTLFPAQVERLLINLMAYRESLLRTAIQNAGQQCLLAFATYPALDYLGQLLETPRDEEVAASTTLEFTLVNALTVSLTLGAGTLAGTADGLYVFTTTESLTISPGNTTGSVNAQCTVPGPNANGYIAGQINVLLSSNTQIASVSNTTTSDGGTTVESDSHYKTRIQQAPNQYSVAGPSGGYKFFAGNVSSSIIDVVVDTPYPGTVQVYILTGPITIQPAASPNLAGIAGGTLLQQVQTALSGTSVRPLNDTVIVSAVTEVDYEVTATITILSTSNMVTLQQLVQQAAVQMAINLASTASQDLVPSQWITALSVNGVYEVILTITANIEGVPIVPQSDGRILLSVGQWANCTNLVFTYATQVN